MTINSQIVPLKKGSLTLGILKRKPKLKNNELLQKRINTTAIPLWKSINERQTRECKRQQCFCAFQNSFFILSWMSCSVKTLSFTTLHVVAFPTTSFILLLLPTKDIFVCCMCSFARSSVCKNLPQEQ